jgi:hypothetical protein
MSEYYLKLGHARLLSEEQGRRSQYWDKAKSRDGLVSTATKLRAGRPGIWIPVRVSLENLQTRSWVHPASNAAGKWGSFTLHICFHGVNRETFILTFTITSTFLQVIIHYHQHIRWYKFQFSFSWLDSPSGPGPSHCWDLEITLRHTTLGRTPLDEWSAQRRELYLTTPNTHKRHTSLAFEPANPASQRPHPTHALDCAATGISRVIV